MQNVIQVTIEKDEINTHPG